GVRPHSSVGTSVALPGMFEQFGTVLGSFVGNPDLVPEESFGWDAGVEVTLLKDRATVDVTYFDADLTNNIANGPGFPPIPTLINLPGVSHRQGIEVSGRVQVLAGLTLGASYTFLDATDPNGAEEVRRPRNAGRGDVNYLFDSGRANINFAAIYNGQMDDLNFAGLPAIVTLDDYWLLNLAASYQLTPQLEIYGRVNNLLDERYEEVLGYNTLGLAAYGGIRVLLEDPSTAAWAKYK
ncbi:MAG: TonB-dependent receptor domain-containing protein, partial [Armatimonadota bacterium]